MYDCEMGLDHGDSVTLHAYLGEKSPETGVSVFVWKQEKNKLCVAISVEGEEQHVVEVTDRGHNITTTKSQD